MLLIEKFKLFASESNALQSLQSLNRRSGLSIGNCKLAKLEDKSQSACSTIIRSESEHVEKFQVYVVRDII